MLVILKKRMVLRDKGHPVGYSGMNFFRDLKNINEKCLTIWKQSERWFDERLKTLYCLIRGKLYISKLQFSHHFREKLLHYFQIIIEFDFH